MRQKWLILFLLITITCHAQEEENKKIKLGISSSANYSFSGLGFIANVELYKNHHIFYIGPKFPSSRSYIPYKGPWGWNVGYRHDYNKNPDKKISFFFIADYQIMGSKSFSQDTESNKRNFVHELFVGYGAQYKFSEHFYLGNAMGIGGHFEVFNNVDLNWKQSYGGYNNLFRIFANYRF